MVVVNKNFLVVASFFYEPLGGECPNGGKATCSFSLFSCSCV